MNLLWSVTGGTHSMFGKSLPMSPNSRIFLIKIYYSTIFSFGKFYPIEVEKAYFLLIVSNTSLP